MDFLLFFCILLFLNKIHKIHKIDLFFHLLLKEYK